MPLKDLTFGMALPQRYPEAAADIATVRRVAQRADALGFADLWLTENTLDHVPCPDPLILLSHVAAVTTRIRLGVAVLVLPVHHPAHIARQVQTLDYVSDGRATLGIGLGRDAHYAEFGVPLERRVRRFTEGVEILRALWTQPSVTYHGQIYDLHDASVLPLPLQKPHPPIWMGAGHPDAIKRAARLADGWMGSGNSSSAGFGPQVALLQQALADAGRDPATFPISKRVFMSVHAREEVAQQEVRHYMGAVYRNADLAERSCIAGTPAQVAERLEELAAMGANHLLLHPIARPEEQLEVLAEMVGLQ